MIGTERVACGECHKKILPSCSNCVGELIRGDESTLICLDCGDVFTMDEEGNILPDDHDN